MSRPPRGRHRRGARVAAVTPGPDPRRSRYDQDSVDLPVILVAALSATGTTVDAFFARLAKGAIWQDQAIRSPDGEIVIQAYLAPDGLRAVVQIGNESWYHHPFDTIHAYGLLPSAEAMTTRDVPLAAVLQHPLLAPLQIIARSTVALNSDKPELGVSIAVDVPRITYPFFRDRS